MALRTFQRNPDKPFVASQSALKMMTECERKFALKYIKKIDVDIDYVEPKYFSNGKAFHSMMELSSESMNLNLAIAIAMSQNLDEIEGLKLFVMRHAYLKKISSNEEVIATEVEVFDDNYVMYIDAVILDKSTNKWWICDYKSVGMSFEPMIEARLVFDSQVCLYSAYADKIAEICKLPIENYAGFTYREIEKPKIRIKKKETRDEFFARLNENLPTVRITNIEKEKIGSLEIIDKHLEKARGFFESPDSTSCTMTKCLSMGQACEFYSQCHNGVTYSKAKGELNGDGKLEDS